MKIRVNTVSPGSIMFPGGGWDRFRAEQSQSFAEFEQCRVSLDRMGTPEEIADVVVFLLSDRASRVNGTNVAVDGTQGRPSAF